MTVGSEEFQPHGHADTFEEAKASVERNWAIVARGGGTQRAGIADPGTPIADGSATMEHPLLRNTFHGKGPIRCIPRLNGWSL